MRGTQRRVGWCGIAVGMVAGLGCAMAHAEDRLPAAQQQAIEQLKSRGAEASIAIYPFRLGTQPMKNVAAVVGLMLEKEGLEHVEVKATPFDSGGCGYAELHKAFATFVQGQKIEQQYALYAEILGTHATGIEEIRIVLLEADGDLVYETRQTPDDSEFKRVKPRNPMTSCVLIQECLLPQMNLPGRPAKSQHMRDAWREQSRRPDKAALDGMEQRLEALKAKAATSELVVYPARVGGDVNAACATNLVNRINDVGLMKARVAGAAPHLDVAGSSNEQRVLWNLAHAFQDYIHQEKPDAEYALYADYMVRSDNGRVHGVHFVVCDRSGDWVIVDFQNEYQADFKAIQPKTLADCDRLVVRRLEHLLR
jgi:hypothetical protein